MLRIVFIFYADAVIRLEMKKAGEGFTVRLVADFPLVIIIQWDLKKVMLCFVLNCFICLVSGGFCVCSLSCV